MRVKRGIALCPVFPGGRYRASKIFHSTLYPGQGRFQPVKVLGGLLCFGGGFYVRVIQQFLLYLKLGNIVNVAVPANAAMVLKGILQRAQHCDLGVNVGDGIGVFLDVDLKL